MVGTGAAETSGAGAPESVFWHGEGTQAASQEWANANGAQTLSTSEFALPNPATTAQVDTNSGAFAGAARGIAHVFHRELVLLPRATESVWVRIEYPPLMENPNVSGIMYHIINEAGETTGTVFVPK